MSKGLFKNTGTEKELSDVQKYIYMGVSGLAIILLFLKWFSVSVAGYSVPVLSLFGVKNSLGIVTKILEMINLMPSQLIIIDVVCKLLILLCVTAWAFNIFRLYRGSDRFGVVAGGASALLSLISLVGIMIANYFFKESIAEVVNQAFDSSESVRDMVINSALNGVIESSGVFPTFSLILCLILSAVMVFAALLQIRFGSTAEKKTAKAS